MTSTKITLVKRVVLPTQTVKKRVVSVSTNFAHSLDDVQKAESIIVHLLKPIQEFVLVMLQDVDTIG